MKTKSKQVSQVFSNATKSALTANQEINDGGLIWRKLSDASGVWRYDFSTNGKRCKGVISKERDGVTLSAAREKLRNIRARGQSRMAKSSNDFSSSLEGNRLIRNSRDINNCLKVG